jgi:hypothetical protein
MRRRHCLAVSDDGILRPDDAMPQESISFSARILRKQPELPRYVVVDPDHVAGRQAAFPAKVSLNGCPEFERNVRPWGKGSDVFFFNLTEPQCRKAGVDTGDVCRVSIRPLD